jgi:diaminohydroxyphosphoribosylaminopyrimidine deaminase / 5-amino-6-(5-phosphoribosylamino)uracil reductase
MRPQSGVTTAPPTTDENAAVGAWRIVLAASASAERMAQANEPARFDVTPGGELRALPPNDVHAALAWRPGHGWETLLAGDDPRRALVDLYLPICSATRTHPITIGHLGQSLDGFIATHSGDSQFVTGPENILHMHRLRALCDAIVVGAGTVAADDPQLTTRQVTGPSPLRVVLDPMRRLGEHHKVFHEPSAATLYVCGASTIGSGETHVGRATLIAVAETPNGLDVTAVMRLLRARGCHRVFVEGGGVTVSMFLQANLLDRLQVAVAPLIIGNGRPAIRLPPRASLRDCHRPGYRVFKMGGDVLFDCDLTTCEPVDGEPPTDATSVVTRVI